MIMRFLSDTAFAGVEFNGSGVPTNLGFEILARSCGHSLFSGIGLAGGFREDAEPLVYTLDAGWASGALWRQSCSSLSKTIFRGPSPWPCPPQSSLRL